MDLYEAEKIAKKIHEKRRQKQELTKEITELMVSLKSYMKNNNKTQVFAGDYSISLFERKKRQVDMDRVQEMISEGKLPEDIMKISEFELLKIVSSKDVKLRGNQFLWK